jgi:hypothetical protein
MELNLAAVLRYSIVNGPGKRAVIWVQGDPIRCHGCQRARGSVQGLSGHSLADFRRKAREKRKEIPSGIRKLPEQRHQNAASSRTFRILPGSSLRVSTGVSRINGRVRNRSCRRIVRKPLSPI